MKTNSHAAHRRVTKRGHGDGRCAMEPMEGRTMLSAGTTGRISGIAVDPSDPSGATMTAALSAPAAASADRSCKPLFAFYVEDLD
jgi:hypothetical protein